jgi:O-antigen ligase
MKDTLSKMFVPVSLLLCSLLAVFIAVFRPRYLSDGYYLGAMIFSQILIATIWHYRTRFMLLLIVVFLWAGIALPFNAVWTSGRWVVLAAGALAGFVIYMKDRQHHFTTFHLVAFFCVLAAVVSAIVSSYPTLATLKALSLLLLFLYGVAGARLAVVDRESQFRSGLLLGCEILTYATAICYFIFHYEIFDNPNSMGAVMGVVATPVMLWGILVSDTVLVRRRRTFAFMLAVLLVLGSYARAGMAGATVGCVLMCIGLRRYRLLIKGIGLALLSAMLIATVLPLRQDQPESITSLFIYKGQREVGVLGSRRSAWQRTSSVIQEHPWFGSGFGTSVTRDEVDQHFEGYVSAPQATREHGNSYLAITEWVGLLGVLPFVTILSLIAINVKRVFVWMRRTGDVRSLAVPLAAMMAGGAVHAAFEDWLFAVGYYLCVFFWAMAFILIDVLPAPVMVEVKAKKRQRFGSWTRAVGPVASPR